MNEFEQQYQELLQFLQFEDYTLLTKRIIDLTLDTEDRLHYSKTIAFLDWLEANESATETKKEKYQAVLQDLYATLSLKPLAIKKTLVTTKGIEKSYGMSRFSLGPIDIALQQG